jgi:hypothetical protein
MIRITVELVSARTGIKSRLAVAEICNNGSGTLSSANYDATFALKQKKIWRMSRVEHFPRKYKNVWYLIQRALNEALNGEER